VREGRRKYQPAHVAQHSPCCCLTQHWLWSFYSGCNQAVPVQQWDIYRCRVGRQVPPAFLTDMGSTQPLILILRSLTHSLTHACMLVCCPQTDQGVALHPSCPGGGLCAGPGEGGRSEVAAGLTRWQADHSVRPASWVSCQSVQEMLMIQGSTGSQALPKGLHSCLVHFTCSLFRCAVQYTSGNGNPGYVSTHSAGHQLLQGPLLEERHASHPLISAAAAAAAAAHPNACRYLEDPTVPQGSKTPTFAAIRCECP
jgi:hypothetical protein